MQVLDASNLKSTILLTQNADPHPTQYRIMDGHSCRNERGEEGQGAPVAPVLIILANCDCVIFCFLIIYELLRNLLCYGNCAVSALHIGDIFARYYRV